MLLKRCVILSSCFPNGANHNFFETIIIYYAETGYTNFTYNMYYKTSMATKTCIIKLQ